MKQNPPSMFFVKIEGGLSLNTMDHCRAPKTSS